MKKAILLYITLACITLTTVAQNTRDVVYLKNGSVIKGELYEISDNQAKIKTTDGSLFIVNTSEVDKFLKEDLSKAERKSSGLGIALEGGFMIGPQTSDYSAPFSFNTVVNYTVGTKNVFGIGTGVEFLGKSYTPVFFEYKTYINDNQVAPFVFFRGGVVLFTGSDEETTNYYDPYYNTYRKYSGGGTFTAGTGVSWVRDQFETYLTFAYRYAHTSYEEKNYSNYPTTYKNNFNRLEIKVGFRF
ncbi:MAG: hypothetical protein U0X39_09070 [Bacteroidales bacterium]